ncbi:F-box protein [Candidatus Synchoanobacter obligatus]|uniref:F-box protein n=1 Tax=Candidatus Synchoanobacter obligatus TaxID=2919597 RepID=A0ABT1L8B3_9GAMM|nr:F-box protein [Candidatus Synchoanobacter obligatus]MCP8352453.1 F-box protein [Candidatus Synchoanobacter obligatus]
MHERALEALPSVVVGGDFIGLAPDQTAKFNTLQGLSQEMLLKVMSYLTIPELMPLALTSRYMNKQLVMNAGRIVGHMLPLNTQLHHLIFSHPMLYFLLDSHRKNQILERALAFKTDKFKRWVLEKSNTGQALFTVKDVMAFHMLNVSQASEVIKAIAEKKYAFEQWQQLSPVTKEVVIQSLITPGMVVYHPQAGLRL